MCVYKYVQVYPSSCTNSAIISLLDGWGFVVTVHPCISASFSSLGTGLLSPHSMALCAGSAALTLWPDFFPVYFWCCFTGAKILCLCSHAVQEQHGQCTVVWVELRPGMVVEERRLLRKWAQSSSASKTLLEQNTADDTSTAYGNVEKRGWESEELGPLRGCFDLYLWAGRCSETKRRH